MPLIIDTDPGIDDMMALLLLLATPRAKAELRMVSLTYGNCSLHATLVNILSLLYVVGKEDAYRAKIGRPKYTDQRPIIAMGSSKPLNGVEPVDATDVHGNDGLGGSHKRFPEYTCPDEWLGYFEPGAEVPADLPFVVAQQEAHLQMLDILRSEPANTVTIMAVGPLTNVARAAAADPQAFSRVKQVLSMGGAVWVPGNVTPVAEFNVYADPVAAAQVYGLTSRRPAEMLPPNSPPALLEMPKPLELTIFSLDTTTKHVMTRDEIETVLVGALAVHPESWLLKWVQIWTTLSLENMARIHGSDDAPLEMHDPLTAAYGIDPTGGWVLEPFDVRVEASGTWCLGKTLADQRGRARLENNPHDFHKWLTMGSGNRVNVVLGSPYPEFGTFLLKSIVNSL